MALRRFAYWKNLASELRAYIRGCEECAKAQQFAKHLRVPLQPLEFPKLFEKISIDHHEVSINKDKTKHRYILVIVDHFSLNFRLVPCKTTTAQETSKHLCNFWLTMYGFPAYFLSDRAPAFIGELMKSLADLSGFTKRIFTSSHRAQSNAAAELINVRTIKYLRIHSDSLDWVAMLPTIECAGKYTPSERSNFSPFKIIFEQEMQLPADLALESFDLTNSNTAQVL